MTQRGTDPILGHIQGLHRSHEWTTVDGDIAEVLSEEIERGRGIERRDGHQLLLVGHLLDRPSVELVVDVVSERSRAGDLIGIVVIFGVRITVAGGDLVLVDVVVARHTRNGLEYVLVAQGMVGERRVPAAEEGDYRRNLRSSRAWIRQGFVRQLGWKVDVQ